MAPKYSRLVKGSPTGSSPDFSGRSGRRRLAGSVRAQRLVANDPDIARAIVRIGEIVHLEDRQVLIHQQDPSNEIFLILHGAIAIEVNRRRVAVRNAGAHVGELALVDPLAVRSATLVALVPTVVFRIPEHKFSRVAARYPDLWRRIAVEIANRLRERNRFLLPPHSQPMLFIGSSAEGRSVVDAMRRVMRRWQLIPRPWTDGVFEASVTTIESLIEVSNEADFAALVLTADDARVARGKKGRVPRDNIVFELGLFMGSLGRERVFILKPMDVDIQIPSDLLGVTWLEYRKDGPGSMEENLRPTCRRIRDRIKKLGAK